MGQANDRAPVVLGLDLSQDLTGWAVLSRDMQAPVFGFFKRKVWDGSEHIELALLRKTILSLHEKHGISHIGHEEIIFDPKFRMLGRKAQLQQAGVAYEICGTLGLAPPMDIHSQEWREQFLGMRKVPEDANAPDSASRRKWWKQQALIECAKRGWYGVTYDDEAEAIGIAHAILVTVDEIYASKSGPLFRRSTQQAARKAMVK